MLRRRPKIQHSIVQPRFLRYHYKLVFLSLLMLFLSLSLRLSLLCAFILVNVSFRFMSGNLPSRIRQLEGQDALRSWHHEHFLQLQLKFACGWFNLIGGRLHVPYHIHHAFQRNARNVLAHQSRNQRLAIFCGFVALHDALECVAMLAQNEKTNLAWHSHRIYSCSDTHVLPEHVICDLMDLHPMQVVRGFVLISKREALEGLALH